jgi:hypothetical protein
VIISTQPNLIKKAHKVSKMEVIVKPKFEGGSEEA